MYLKSKNDVFKNYREMYVTKKTIVQSVPFWLQLLDISVISKDGA